MPRHAAPLIHYSILARAVSTEREREREKRRFLQSQLLHPFSYSSPLSSFHVWNKAEACKRIWQYSSRKAGWKTWKVFQTIRSTRPVLFSKRRKRRSIVTMAQRAPVSRKNAQTKICISPKQWNTRKFILSTQGFWKMEPSSLRVVLFHRSIIRSYFVRFVYHRSVSPFLKYTRIEWNCSVSNVNYGQCIDGRHIAASNSRRARRLHYLHRRTKRFNVL